MPRLEFKYLKTQKEKDIKKINKLVDDWFEKRTQLRHAQKVRSKNAFFKAGIQALVKEKLTEFMSTQRELIILLKKYPKYTNSKIQKIKKAFNPRLRKRRAAPRPKETKMEKIRYKITSKTFLKAIRRKITRKRIVDYKWVMRVSGRRKAGPNEKRGKIEYARYLIGKSNLPKLAKEIIPYLPMQESKYKDHVKSSAGALGAWQFMPAVAKRYPNKQNPLLKGDPGKSGDKRTDYILSTKAAIAYFEKLFAKMRTNPNYKALIRRYGSANKEDFLSLVTINAYNSGPDNLNNAMRLLLYEKDLRKEIDLAFKNGGYKGLYYYMTKAYCCMTRGPNAGLYGGKYGIKWGKNIKRGEKYGPQSSNYVFEILSYKWIHEKKA